MARIPRDTRPESSLALLREGNTFITSGCKRYRSDIFQTRLLLQKTLCLHGEAAARLFYDTAYFTREDAAPAFLNKTLFGQGGVQGLDGEMHRVRKAMFLELMSEASIAELARFTTEAWQQARKRWQARDRIVLLHEVQEIHCRAVHRWAGVPLEERQADARCRDLAALIDGAGGIGKRHWKARQARKRTEAQLSDLVDRVRANRFKTSEDRALFYVSWQRDADNKRLSSQVAAVELLNLLRPTVAIAHYVIFAALALHEQPQWYRRLQDDDTLIEPFVQEVRRYYTFFPFVAARVRQAFTWQGYHFPQGIRVLLDLYGTNRDARTWKAPHWFQPERFQKNKITPYNFIPQGGGDHATNHRCPGEWFTIALMSVALKQLTREMRYHLPEQDLGIDWSRMPIVPRGRFVIDRVVEN